MLVNGAGGDEGSVTYTINPKPVYKTSAEGVGYYDDGESEIIVSGDFPGLTVDGHVPLNIRMHSWYNYIKSVGTVKGLMVTQTIDTSGRPYQIIYTGTTIPTKTVTYIYGLLSNGTENSFLIPTITTSGNITITNIINENGQITKQSQSSLQSGSTTKSIEYAYYSDAAQPNYGLVNTVDGPKAGIGDKVTYTYDDFGNLASQYQTIKGIIRTTSYIGYNNFAQPERIISPNSLVQLFVYNADGTVNTEINGIGGSTGAISGQTTAYTYNNLKQVVSKTNPDGDVTSYTYNLIGRLSGVLLPDKSVIVYSYYSNGILSDEAYSDGSNNIALVKNNVLGMNGRINRTYSGYNQNKLYTDYYYDRNGNLEQSNTAEGIRELWSYDALNRLKAHTNGIGGIDTKDYDINNNIISAMDALNAGSNPLSYRNGNILTQEVNSDFGTKTYTYNEADQLTQRINVDRKCNYNSIDEIGRYGAFVCTSNGGTTPSEYQVNDNYTYDQSRYGRLDKVSSSVEYDVNTFYNYDVYDRITQKRQENLLWYVSAENKNLTVNYSYSIGGKQTKIILPSGRVIDYNYNLSTATLTGITLDSGALIRNITYDGANRVTGWLWGRSNASYNINYIANISSINTIFNKDSNGAINYSLTYGYDNDSRITSVNRNNGLNDTYKYDSANRLALESRSNGNTAVYTVGYGYDANGNRTSLNATGSHLQPASSASYAYSGNKLTSFNKDGVAQALNYTANAEVAYGPFTAAYDNSSRRKADHAANYYYYMNYNHKNERITRGLSSNIPASVVQYVYDEDSHLIGEYSGNTPIVEYVWFGDTPVAAIYGSGAATKIYYIITDHLNTPRRLVDSSNQAIVWSWDSTAFGLGNPIGSVTFNLRFPGQYYDVGTNQFYNHNRFYNPELGRYMEPDPIGLEGGLNPYAYAGSNPVMNSDPSGLALQEIENYAFALNDSMNQAWINSMQTRNLNLASPLEYGGQLSQKRSNGDFKVVTYGGEGGRISPYNRTPWGSNYLAQYHTHPYNSGVEGLTFSGGDIFGITSQAGKEYPLGFVKFVEAGSMRFAVEIVNVEQAQKFASNYTHKGLDSYFNNVLFPNSPGGTSSEMTRNGLKNFLQNNSTGLKYYESFDSNKLKFKEIR